MEPEQRSALLAAKLRALVAEGWRRDASTLTPRPFPGGASLVDPTSGDGWCLVSPSPRDRDPMDRSVDETPEHVNPRGWLGGSIVWASRNERTHLDVIVDTVDGNDARRAALFGNGPTLWRSVGRAVHQIAPIPFQPVAPPDAVVELFRVVIADAGADPVIDHGVLRAEYRGLEVGRVVASEDGVPRLDVGVGKHDRLANSMLGHDRDVLVALRNAVASVKDHRRAGAAPHPANQLVNARWMRHVVVNDPSLVGVDVALDAVEGTEPAGLKRATPAIALGRNVVVACGTGSDLDTVTFAADARAWYAPNAELVIVLSESDVLAPQRLLVERVHNARLVTIAPGWKDFAL